MNTEVTNVWIVEDDDMFRKSLEDLINISKDYNLVYSTDSIEKVIKSFGTKEKPDIILQDIGLSGLSGIEAIPIYRKRYPDVLIIILTIFEDDVHVFEAIKEGANGYILKRTTATDILKGIKDVMQGGASITPSIAKKMMKMLSYPDIKKKLENPLTERELIILKYLTEGHTINAIGEILSISRHTVDSHTKNIYKKLHVHNRRHLVAKALRRGLV
jgi:DNA-binding NarL/FixJ family response regulator